MLEMCILTALITYGWLHDIAATAEKPSNIGILFAEIWTTCWADPAPATFHWQESPFITNHVKEI